MYADTNDLFKNSVEKLRAKQNEYPEFIRHFEELLQRKHDWAIIYRSLKFIKSSGIYNYADITIRILRDVVLSCTKSFSIVPVIEFCILVLDTYLTKRLKSHAYNPSNEPSLLYSSLCKKSKGNLQIKTCNYEDNYLVQSEKDQKVYFVVNAHIGMCSCPNGNTGAFCKHQFVLLDNEKISLFDAPALTQADRYDLGILALGDKCILSHFLSRKEENDKNDSGNSGIKIAYVERLCDPTSAISSEVESTSQTTNDYIITIMSEIERVLSLCKNKTSQSAITRLVKALNKIKTERETASALCIMSLALSAKMRAKRWKSLRCYRLLKRHSLQQRMCNRPTIPLKIPNRTPRTHIMPNRVNVPYEIPNRTPPTHKVPDRVNVPYEIPNRTPPTHKMPDTTIVSDQISDKTSLNHIMQNRNLHSDEILNTTVSNNRAMKKTLPAQSIKVLAKKRVLKQFARKRVVTPDFLSKSIENNTDSSFSS